MDEWSSQCDTRLEVDLSYSGHSWYSDGTHHVHCSLGTKNCTKEEAGKKERKESLFNQGLLSTISISLVVAMLLNEKLLCYSVVEPMVFQS